MKRIIATLSAAAMLTAVVSPVGATWGWPGMGGMSDPTTLSNSAKIKTNIEIGSSTGYNTQANVGGNTGSKYTMPKFGYRRGGSSDLTLVQGNVLETGDAGAEGTAQIVANNGDNCDCADEVKNKASIKTKMNIGASTGGNAQINTGSVKAVKNMGDLQIEQLNGMSTGDAYAGGTIFTIANSDYALE